MAAHTAKEKKTPKKSKSKKDYRYGYGESIPGESGGLCDKMSFTAAEAYKMLRTKINLIIPHDMETDPTLGEPVHKCKIIGITSALRGEGKSTTSINLAYTIAETGSRVLLMEADMRLPNLAKGLSLQQSLGLSNLLTGQANGSEVLQRYASKDGNKIFVITAGDIPPRPSELLESANMKKVFDALSVNFDYIIVDLPPVTAVTDAISVSQVVDGMLLVVRQDYCDKVSLQDTLYQFKLTNTKVLGVVFNSSDGPGGKGSYYRKGRKYYGSRGYGSYGYGSTYGNNGKSN